MCDPLVGVQAANKRDDVANHENCDQRFASKRLVAVHDVRNRDVADGCEAKGKHGVAEGWPNPCSLVRDALAIDDDADRRQHERQDKRDKTLLWSWFERMVVATSAVSNEIDELSAEVERKNSTDPTRDGEQANAAEFPLVRRLDESLGRGNLDDDGPTSD